MAENLWIRWALRPAWAHHVERCCAKALDFVEPHMGDRETKEILSRVERKVWPVSNLTQQDSTPLNSVFKCAQLVDLNMLRACTVDKSSPFERCFTVISGFHK